MRLVRCGLLLCYFVLSVSVWARQTQQVSTPSAASRDPQAVTVLNQALSVAGGAAAITAIADYTGTGNITYPSEQDAYGPRGK